MNDDASGLTPKEKLALSRTELLAVMGLEETHTASGDTLVQGLPEPAPSSPLAARVRNSLVGRWWHRHPARSVYELVEPGLQRYARDNPGRLMAYSAGAGGVLMLLKPWRLLSVGAVIALLFRASDIADAVAGVVRSHRDDPELPY